jgi:hypothetical protein
MINLIVEHNGVLTQPAIEDGVSLTWERYGTPGKLSFKVVKDFSDTAGFVEGDAVRFSADGANMFFGFVFKKSRDREQRISVTAYDQLRYLKNKDTVQYENKKASELLAMLAGDYNLRLGTVEDTGHYMSRTDDNASLFDVLQTALDTTLRETGRLYVLYDDFGALTLRNISGMRLDLLIDSETGENFSYESSIDDQTYNQVKLTFDNDETGKREVYIARDGENINRWGVLQHFDTLNDPALGASKADALLGLYNSETRKLTVKDVFGDTRVRPGCAVAVSLALGDVNLSKFMLVNKAAHKWSGERHTMDLTLIDGGQFVA